MSVGHSEVGSPNGRPEPGNVRETREADIGFNISTSEAKFIPSLNHGALVVQIVGLLLREGDDQRTIGRGDCCRVQPLQIIGRL